MAENSGLKIKSLVHDVVAAKSHVGLVWESDPSKSLGLEVTFGCSLEQLQAEAEKAVRLLATELASISVNLRP